MKLKHHFQIFFVLVLVFCGRPAAHAEQPVSIPGPVRCEYLGTYDVARLNKILTTELDSFTTVKNTVSLPPASNDVKLYRVVYATVVPEKDNRPVEASGLVAVPVVEQKRLPLLSYQHGTVFSRNAVPSSPELSAETRLMVAQFAGNGYVVIGADYIGKGLSAQPDSYMVKESTAQACLDMLTAARGVLGQQGIQTDGLFLSGWSQGAWSTMVFRNRLEELGIPVKAAATACTPNDLYLLVTRWINHPSPLDARWLVGTAALLINSHERYYGLPGLSQAAIKPAYWQTARDFYENKIDWSAAEKILPKTVSELLDDDFAKASSLAANRFYRLLLANQAYAWRYATPTRYYYGKVDEVMPPQVATMPVQYQQTLGGAPAEAVYAGDQADHRGTFVFGIRDQRQWFDALRQAK
jgi:hypothetical protein